MQAFFFFFWKGEGAGSEGTWRERDRERQRWRQTHAETVREALRQAADFKALGECWLKYLVARLR